MNNGMTVTSMHGASGDVQVVGNAPVKCSARPHTPGLWRRARRGAALVIAGLAFGLGPVEPESAAQTVVLTSNLAETTETGTGASTGDVGQLFHTGDHSDGYLVTALVVSSSDSQSDAFDVELCGEDDTVQEYPNDDCTEFTAPSAFASGNLVFTHNGVRIDPGTNYVIVAKPRGTNPNLHFAYTTSGNEVGETDWSIKNRHYWKGTSWNTTGSFRQLKIAVRGREWSNTPATGKPRIVNAGPYVGRRLYARVSDIRDDTDGLHETMPGETGGPLDCRREAAECSYQWIRVDGGTPTDIPNATGRTYTPVAADVGKMLRVKVTFKDKRGSLETLTSDARGPTRYVPLFVHVEGVTFSNPASSFEYAAGENIDITVQLSRAVTVESAQVVMMGTRCTESASVTGVAAYQSGGGTDPLPGVALGGRAVYRSGSGTATLTFRCTVPDSEPVRAGILGVAEQGVIITAADETVGGVARKVDVNRGPHNAVLTSAPSCSEATHPNQIWCGTLTVGRSGSTTGYSSSYGSLQNKNFTRSGTQYQVGTLSVSGNTGNRLLMNATPAGWRGSINRSGFELRLGSVSYPFPADRTTGSGDARWESETTPRAPWVKRNAPVLVSHPNQTLVLSYTGTEYDVGAKVPIRLIGAGRNRGRGQRSESDRPTARFDAIPDNHNGTDPIEFELHFSREPEDLSYKTVGGALLEVTGGTITGARRLTAQDNTSWEVSAQPSGNADLVIRLPNRACDQANAVCVGGQPLAAKVSVTIPREGRGKRTISRGGRGEQTVPLAPFTAAFAGRVPTEHDGAASTKLEFEFHLSHHPGHLSYVTVRDNLFTVTGGTIESAWRRTQGDEKHMHWNLRIDPAGDGDVTIALKPTTNCAGTPGVCRLSDNAMLNSHLRQVIKGPATLSVADATVAEGADATLDFVVTLSRTRSGSTTVQYATSDGTATAGSDYTATSGTLTFGVSDTSKTVSVPVSEDAHDDGGETVTLTLSNASPSAYVRISDGTATGTITNADPMPRAWLGRFGRTVGMHVTEALGDRLRGSAAVGSHVTVAGHRLPLDGRGADPGRLAALVAGVVGLPGLSRGPADDGEEGARGPAESGRDWWPGGPATAAWPGSSPGRAVGLPGARQALLGSSFRLSMGAADGDAPASGRLTAWGRVAATRFNGREGRLSLDGDVLTGTLGVDTERERWLLGLALAHSRGDGSYGMADAGARGVGELENALTSVHPYVRYALTERLAVWGVLGYGRGGLDFTQEGAATLATDADFVMGAVGGRGVLLAPAESGGFRVATRTDAMFTRTTSEGVTGMDGNLAATEADAHRVRVTLEGGRGFGWGEGRSLRPAMEVGLRHDSGDAESGFGLELGGRVQYADPRYGVTVEVMARGLLAHEDGEYREWGGSGTLRVAPGATGQGWRVAVSPSWGATGGGVEGLWRRENLAGLASEGTRATPGGRLNAEVGYGLAAPYGRGLLTPYAGTEVGDGAERSYRLGMRLRLDGGPVAGLEASLEGTRQEPAGRQPAGQGLWLQGTWSF